MSRITKKTIFALEGRGGRKLKESSSLVSSVYPNGLHESVGPSALQTKLWAPQGQSLGLLPQLLAHAWHSVHVVDKPPKSTPLPTVLAIALLVKLAALKKDGSGFGFDLSLFSLPICHRSVLLASALVREMDPSTTYLRVMATSNCHKSL